MMYPLSGAQSPYAVAPVVKAQGLFCAAWQVVASYPQQLTNPQQQHGSSRQPGFFFFFVQGQSTASVQGQL